MSYYEFKEPYYALIMAETTSVHAPDPTKHKFVQVYEENICALEGITDYMKFKHAKGRKIYDDEAFLIFAKTRNNENVPYFDLKKKFNAIPLNSVVAVDNALR